MLISKHLSYDEFILLLKNQDELNMIRNSISYPPPPPYSVKFFIKQLIDTNFYFVKKNNEIIYMNLQDFLNVYSMIENNLNSLPTIITVMVESNLHFIFDNCENRSFIDSDYYKLYLLIREIVLLNKDMEFSKNAEYRFES